MPDTTVRVEYIGAVQNFSEVTITGNQQVWRIGSSAFVETGRASQLVASGKFSSLANDPAMLPANQAKVGATPSASGVAMSGSVPYPADFRWSYPYRPALFDNGTTITHDVESVATADSACYTGPIYHVDTLNGSDSNTGLGDYAGDFKKSPLKSAKKAADLLKAGGVAGQIALLYYPDSATASLRTASSVISVPTVPVLIRGYGGKARLRVADNYTFSQVASSTTYKLAGTTVSRVFDLLNKDPDGNYIELTKTTGTADTALPTAGTWATVGSDQYIRRADGAAVTNANTLVTRSAVVASLDATTPSGVMFENLELEGGYLDILHTNADAPDRKFVFKDCIFRYGHANHIRAKNSPGLVVFLRCEARYSTSDLYNFHWDINASLSRMFAIVADCTGFDAGIMGNGITGYVSHNCVTNHETGSLIVINGRFERSFGGVFTGVDNSHTFLVGGVWRDGKGDTIMGGGHPPITIQTEGTARCWMYKGIVDGLVHACRANGDSQIALRGTVIAGGALTGNVTSW